MNICILDSSQHEDKDLCLYTSKLITELENLHCFVSHHRLVDLKIKYCQGCFGCWVKTPGMCVIKDDMERIYPSIIKSDLLLMVSPLKMGFINEVLKKTEDRMIPLLHPYFEIIKNESHQKLFKFNARMYNLFIIKLLERYVL